MIDVLTYSLYELNNFHEYNIEITVCIVFKKTIDHFNTEVVYVFYMIRLLRLTSDLYLSYHFCVYFFYFCSFTVMKRV